MHLSERSNENGPGETSTQCLSPRKWKTRYRAAAVLSQNNVSHRMCVRKLGASFGFHWKSRKFQWNTQSSRELINTRNTNAMRCFERTRQISSLKPHPHNFIVNGGTHINRTLKSYTHKTRTNTTTEAHPSNCHHFDVYTFGSG